LKDRKFHCRCPTRKDRAGRSRPLEQSSQSSGKRVNTHLTQRHHRARRERGASDRDRIADRGIGIPTDELNQVVRRFHRDGRSRRRTTAPGSSLHHEADRRTAWRVDLGESARSRHDVLLLAPDTRDADAAGARRKHVVITRACRSSPGPAHLLLALQLFLPIDEPTLSRSEPRHVGRLYRSGRIR